MPGTGKTTQIQIHELNRRGLGDGKTLFKICKRNSQTLANVGNWIVTTQAGSCFPQWLRDPAPVLSCCFARFQIGVALILMSECFQYLDCSSAILLVNVVGWPEITSRRILLPSTLTERTQFITGFLLRKKWTPYVRTSEKYDNQLVQVLP